MTLTELGQEIRARRDSYGYSIEEVAGRIKVSARTLRAIEEGNAQGLPHAVYTRGFIRAYGSLVGMDSEELTRVLEGIFPPEEGEEFSPSPQAFTRPVPTQELGKRIAVLLLLLLLLGGVVAGGWYVSIHYGSQIMEMVKQPFSAVTPATGVTPLMAAANSSLENPETTTVGGLEEKASAPAALAQEQLVTSAETLPAATTPVAATQNGEIPPHVVADSTTPSPLAGLNQHEKAAIAANKQIVYVTATEDCYLGITPDNGKLLHHMLKAGESYPVVFSSALKLLLGNAGGISIRYNGKDMGEIGARGKPRLLLFPQ